MDKLYLKNFTKIKDNERNSIHKVALYKKNSASNDEYYIKKVDNRDLIDEYITSRLSQYFLGKYSSISYIIEDQDNNQLLSGSKALKNFSTMYNFIKNYDSDNILTIENSIRDQHNKNIDKFIGFEDVSLVSYYLNFGDMNAINFGLIEEDSRMHYARIDLDGGLHALEESINIFEIIRDIKDDSELKRLNFNLDNTISSIKNIINSPNQDLFDIVDKSINDLKQYLTDEDIMKFENYKVYLEKLGIINYDDQIEFFLEYKKTHPMMDNFEKFSNYIKQGLVQRKSYFDDILYGLELEKSIEDNDVNKLAQLIADSRFANYEFHSIDEDFVGNALIEFAEYRQKYQIKEILDNYYSNLNFTCPGDDIIEIGTCLANCTLSI